MASKQWREFRLWLLAAVVVVAAGLVAVFFYAIGVEDDGLIAVLGYGTMIAFASFAIGAVPGLLFGVPRSRAAQSGEAQAPPNDGRNGASDDVDINDPRLAAQLVRNSNLVEVSDWLTKILVGVGLTQVGQIGEALSSLGDYLSPGFGGKAGSGAFGVGVFLYFLISGFLVAYLLTSRYLAWLLTQAEIDQLRRDKENLEDRLQLKTEELQSQAEVTEYQRLEAQARDIGATAPLEADRVDDEMSGIARKIEEIYATLESGPQRTQEILVQTARVMGLVRNLDDGQLPADRITQLHTDGLGGRLSAMAAVRGALKPQPEALGLVLDSIGKSRTAYEQYEALRALEVLIPKLTDEQKEEACDVLDDQRSGGARQWIARGTARWAVAASLDAQLRCHRGAPVDARVASATSTEQRTMS